MKFLILLSVFTSFTFAQVDSLSEALKYYPLEIGNYWEYKNYNWEFPIYYDSSAHSIEIIGDTILPNNKKYKILLQKNIPDDGFSLKTFERVDSLTACVFRYSSDTVFSSNEYLIDSLLAQPGDYFTGSITGFRNRIFSTLCVSEYAETVLNLNTDVKEFQDQSLMSGLNYTLAKKLGFVKSIVCEFSCGSSNLVYAFINSIEYGERITSLKEDELFTPDKYFLYQNYPNPFNPVTKIKYSIPVETHRDASLQMVTLKVFDVLGNEISTLVNEEQSAGLYNVEFRMQNLELSSGIYFYRLQVYPDKIGAGNFRQTKKMNLVK